MPSQKLTRAFTARELEAALKRVIETDPNAPVQIGTCICGTRVLTFDRRTSVDCPKCQAETSVQPITVRITET
jgi:hypothetical protein